MIHPTPKQLRTVADLRAQLHAIPELSMQEHRTMEHIKSFLRENTTCTVHEEDGWLWAEHHVSDTAPTVVFRADTDAIPCAATGQPFHGCGHDGHAAAVAGLAYLLETAQPDKNVIFLFQPGEETGEGAKQCCSLFSRIHANAIYGCHTIPGYPLGHVLWREDAFACASRGMILHFLGQQCHAAYPETGRNPAPVAVAVVGALDGFLHGENTAYRGMVLATVVGLQIGGRRFGVSAGDGELCLTVRAHFEDDLEALISRITDFAVRTGQQYGIAVEREFLDVFPDTVNDTQTAAAFRAQMEACGIPVLPLAEPMRWSEDFGHYCKRTRGVFFGIGAGEDSPALHTDDFCFNDALLARILEVYLAILELPHTNT